MTNDELLGKVKKALGIGGTYQDDTLIIYINETKEYLLDAGVAASVLNSDKALGIICRGVADLWNYGAGNAKLSEYFMQRATQLASHQSSSEVSVSDTETYTKEEIEMIIANEFKKMKEYIDQRINKIGGLE